MTPQDGQEPTVEQALKELRGMFPHSAKYFHVKHMDGAWWHGSESSRYDWWSITTETIYHFSGATLAEAMAQVRRWFAGQKGLLFCSCGAACTEAEYAEHQKRGHDSGESQS